MSPLLVRIQVQDRMDVTHRGFSMSSMPSGRRTLRVSGSRKAMAPLHTATPQYVTSGRDRHTSSSRNTSGARAPPRRARNEVYPIPFCLEKCRPPREREGYLCHVKSLPFPPQFSLSVVAFSAPGFFLCHFFFHFFLHIFLKSSYFPDINCGC